MILATYQPRIPNKRTSVAASRQKLIDCIGYDPIFCVAADSLKELWINSLMAIPVCPVVLQVYYTNKVPQISKVDWDLYLDGKIEFEDIRCMLPQTVGSYQYEYLLKKEDAFPIYTVDLYEAVEKKLVPKLDGSDWQYY